MRLDPGCPRCVQVTLPVELLIPKASVILQELVGLTNAKETPFAICCRKQHSGRNLSFKRTVQQFFTLGLNKLLGNGTAW